MANEKRLIDANAYPCQNCEVSYCYKNCEKFNAWFNKTVDAVEVVFCDECENYGKCYPETIFRLARIEKPFCCVGKRKTNTNFGAKMDGDGNG